MPSTCRDAASASSSVATSRRDRGRAPATSILGLPSSGLHANGYSLVRALLAQWDLDLAEPYQARLRRSLGDAEADAVVAAAPNEAMATLGEILLTPTRIYARAVLAARAAVRAAGHDIHGIAHITGGGLPGNVPRAMPDGLAARLDPARWPMPSVMRLFGGLGGLDDEELRATFNGGLGMVVVLPRRRRSRPRPRCSSARHPVGDRRRGRATPPSSTARATSRAPSRVPRESRRRIAVGVSGAGLEPAGAGRGRDRGELGGEIVLVFADRACPALDWAAEQGIETALVPGGDDATLADDPRRASASTSSCSPATCGSSGRGRSPRSTAGSSTPTRRSCRPSPAPMPCATRWPTA